MANNPAGSVPAPVILVVDDDRRVRESIQWSLEEEGFAVETAADGLTALARAVDTLPSLVVLDMRMPLVDGAAFADRLRAILGTAPPIVLITADGRPAETARRVGAYAYLPKPFELDHLVAAVRRGLDSHSG